MKRYLPIAALAVFAGISSLPAQQSEGGGTQSSAAGSANRSLPRPLPVVVWRAELPGGSFVVARNAINAISTQQYILDGGARVTEVNISIGGPFQPRFYYLEPIAATAAQTVPGGQTIADRAQTQVQTAVNRVVPGDPIWAKVVKNYPTTTHAGTIEFRLETREQLDKLYESLERTWMTGKSEIFTPDGTAPYHSKKKSEDGESDDQNAESPDADALGPQN